MYKNEPIILVTGAAGKLGRLTLAALLDVVPPSRLRATSRHTDALADLAAQGVDVRAADYDRPETLDAAFSGADRLLLISGNEVGKRESQHRNAIAAAKRTGVGFVAYTSILKADSTAIKLAPEHLTTERELERSGIPFALLRNGWYFENDTASIPAMLANGVLIGASGDGRISSAARADYARAAAAVLLGDDAGRIYELAGDGSFTKAELAAEVARQSGKPIAYRNVPADEYEWTLISLGVPAGMAAIIADCDVQTERGALFDDSRILSTLTRRPTATLAEAVAQALRNHSTPA